MTRASSPAATALVIVVLLWSVSVPLITAFRPLEPQCLPTTLTVTGGSHCYSHDRVRVHAGPHRLPLPRAAGSSALHASVVPSKQDKGVDTLTKVSTVVAATMVTYCLHNYQNPFYHRMTPVLACGLVALLSSILLPERLALAALCGSFAGMAKMAVIPTLLSPKLLDSALLLGMVCAAMLGLFDKNGWLVGKGGRLGVIAQLSCTLQFIVQKLFANNHWKWRNVVQRPATTTAAAAALFDFSLYKGGVAVMAKEQQLVTLMLYSVAGALFMRTYKHLTSKLLPSRFHNSVAAVGVTGVVGGFALSPIQAGAALCGSFVSMSNSNTLPGMVSLILASILAGAWQLGLAGVLLGGWGGKLGTAALLGVWTYQLAFSRLVSQLGLENGGKRKSE